MGKRRHRIRHTPAAARSALVCRSCRRARVRSLRRLPSAACIGYDRSWLPKSNLPSARGEGLLRHPSFRGLARRQGSKRDRAAALDAAPRPSNTPSKAPSKAPPKVSSKASLKPPPARNQQSRVARRKKPRRSSPACELTHPDRVLWPERGITKAATRALLRSHRVLAHAAAVESTTGAAARSRRTNGRPASFRSIPARR